MNTSYKYIWLSIFFVLIALQTACKKEFLELDIKGFLIAKSTNDYEQLLNAVFLQSELPASAFLGDEVAAQEIYFNNSSRRSRRLFQYEDRIYESHELPEEIISPASYIRKQYIFNKIIAEVMQSTHGTEEQKRRILAESKVGRAVCHLMFLQDFAMPYNTSTAATDPGIPILTSTNVSNRFFKQASIQEVYEFMIKDLTEAQPDLSVLTHRRKFSKLTAEFYLSKIYLNMADFETAKTHIDAAFLEIDRSKIPVALYDYNKVLADGGEWGADRDIGYGPTNQPIPFNNTQLIYSISSSLLEESSYNTFVFSPRTVALFNPTDQRLRFYSSQESFGKYKFPLGMKRYLSRTSDIGASLPDLYLMRAEIRARTNDLRGAVADVEYLRKNRMASHVAVPAPIAANQYELVCFILDERIREFTLTGMRWQDMRRLSVDPIYNKTVIYRHNMYDRNGNISKTFRLRPERFALRFGERLLSESLGLQENK